MYLDVFTYNVTKCYMWNLHMDIIVDVLIYTTKTSSVDLKTITFYVYK